MKKEIALQVWADEIGNQEYAYDFSGRKIKREDYGVKNQVGWVIAPIKPFELGGPNDKNNLMIMHHQTYEEKGNNYPIFEIINKKYIIQYDEKDDFYYIEQIIEDDDEDDFYNI